MSLLEQLLNAQDGGVVKQLAQNFNLDEGQAQSAIGSLLPALTGAMSQRAAQSEGGLDSLLAGLTGGGAERFLGDPSALGSPDAVDHGNGILGQLLGSKDVSRALADQASGQTGISPDVLKAMLPVIASLAAGVMGSQRSQAASFGGGTTDQGLLGMLDFNKDGSPMDDILGMASKFFSK